MGLMWTRSWHVNPVRARREGLWEIVWREVPSADPCWAVRLNDLRQAGACGWRVRALSSASDAFLGQSAGILQKGVGPQKRTVRPDADKVPEAVGAYYDGKGTWARI